MKSYSQKMIEYLECDGWEVEQMVSSNLEWWADEIWKIKSTWSPEGSEAYLTFLVDPMHEGSREKGQSVWGIGCSKHYPSERKKAESCAVISLSKAFKREIPEFQYQMDKLRYIE